MTKEFETTSEAEKEEKEEQGILETAIQEDLIVKKSNTFITAKYNSSLLENKLLAISLTRLDENPDGSLTATISPAEIKEMLGRENDNSHIYHRLKEVAASMTGHSIGMEDGKGNFKFFSMITNADYEERSFRITFNKSMTPHISNLKTKYTTYSLANSLQFKSNHSFRMYELLRMESYLITEQSPVVTKDYSVSELKFMLGILDLEDRKVREAKENGATWEEMEAVVPRKRYKLWSNFKHCVLDKAKTELDMVSDLAFDYTPIRQGVGGKVRKVRLFIQLNDPNERVVDDLEVRAKKIRKNNQRYQEEGRGVGQMSHQMEELIGHGGLSEKDLQMFFEVAGGNEENVIRAIHMADKQKKIKNYVGWIRSCIMNEYDEKKGASYPSIQSQLEKAKEAPDGEMFVNLWNRTKQKKEYRGLLDCLGQKGMEEDYLELLYSPKDRVDMFMDWVRTGNIGLK